MAATRNVTQLSQSYNSLVPRHGILTLVGFGIRVTVDRGHLVVHDGIGAERYQYRLPRVGHRLKRLVVVGSDGLVSLAALKWLREQDVAFTFLERNGRVLSVVGPVGSSDARLRRAQAVAITNGVGLEICRTLIVAKIQGQENVLRERMNCPSTADAIARFRNRLSSAESFDAIRNLEANAASSYFSEWRDLPVTWPKADLQRIPEHWRFVGSRQSPLTGGPRLAVTPVHAILNYCFALLEAETRLAISALGLDAGLGVGLHTDTNNRDSLAFDVLEPIRPKIEMWLLDWVAKEPLRRADFCETGTGNCRLMSQICTKLSETASVWGKLVAPWAEYVARTLWKATEKPLRKHGAATRLTQANRRKAQGGVYPPAMQPIPTPQRICRTCGATLKHGQQHCASCARLESSNRMIEISALGRVATHSPQAEALRSASRRRHAADLKVWQDSKHPDCLTEKRYLRKIQPDLRGLTVSAIASALSISLPYATNIRAGRLVPHARHWEALAKLAGVSL